MDKIKIYKKERGLLLDLLGKYEPKTKLEESVKYSVECKIRKAYNYSHLIPVSIAEVEEKLKSFPAEMLYFYIDEVTTEYFEKYFTNQLKYHRDTHVLYSDEYWAGIIHTSDGDILYLPEAVERLKNENNKAYEELVEKVKFELENPKKIIKNEL